MRMWCINPRLLCRKHLCAEHFEIHKMIGNLKNSRKWAESLTRLGFLEPQNALDRHDRLAGEMIRRGYAHKSPLNVDVELPIGNVDTGRSRSDLRARCSECLKGSG